MSKEYWSRRKCTEAHANQHPHMIASSDSKREKWLVRSARNAGQKTNMQKRRRLASLTIPSQFCHLVIFTLKRPRTQLERGALITSIDVDVGSRQLGEVNKGRNDFNVNDYLSERYVGAVEEKTVPLLTQFFDALAIPVTFAVRGQLTEVDNSIVEPILDSPIEHEIAAHGYSHRAFTSLSIAEAQKELQMISTGFQKLGLRPTSFVFPKNRVSHLDLLDRFRYESYREEGGLLKDGMFIRKKGQLYDVHPGLYLGFTYNPIFLTKMIDIAVTRRLPFHIWFHPQNIYEIGGSTQKKIKGVFSPLYDYAKKKEKEGTLKFETMRSIINEIKTSA
jgi:peptidoglycan/xylan/chitin deacetylase (PgdA/CDA1 family)